MKLRQGFEGIEFLSVEDVSDGCGDKLKIIIVTDAFEGIAELIYGSDDIKSLGIGMGGPIDEVEKLKMCCFPS